MKIKGAFPVRWAAQDGENGKDGVNAIRLDLDNENDSILTDGSGNVVGTLPSTTARLYDGANQVSGGIEWSCKATGVTVEESA